MSKPGSFVAYLALGFLLAGGACKKLPTRAGGASDAAVSDAAAFPGNARAGSSAPNVSATADAALTQSSDAATETITPDAATSDPCANGACESFENATLDLQRWELATPNCSGSGQIDIDTQQHHTGASSLRVRGAAGYCNHVFVRARAPLFAPSDPLYVRLYVRVAAAPGAGHVTWLALHDDAAGKDLRLGAQAGVMIWNRESDDATLPELSPTGMALSTTPQPAVWSCVEFLLDAQSSTLQTWVDRKPMLGLSSDGTPTPDADRQWQNQGPWHPQISDVRLGFESYANEAATLWFDDVVIAKQRVGCLPP